MDVLKTLHSFDISLKPFPQFQTCDHRDYLHTSDIITSEGRSGNAEDRLSTLSTFSDAMPPSLAKRRPSALEIETIHEVTEKLYSQFVQQVAKTLYEDEKEVWNQAIKKEANNVVYGEDGMPVLQCKKNKQRDFWTDEAGVALRPLELLNVKNETPVKKGIEKKSSFRQAMSGKSSKTSVRFSKESKNEVHAARCESASTEKSVTDDGSSNLFLHLSRDRFLSLRKPKNNSNSDETHSDTELSRAALLFNKLHLNHVVVPKRNHKNSNDPIIAAVADQDSTELQPLKSELPTETTNVSNHVKISGTKVRHVRNYLNT